MKASMHEQRAATRVPEIHISEDELWNHCLIFYQNSDNIINNLEIR